MPEMSMHCRIITFLISNMLSMWDKRFREFDISQSHLVFQTVGVRCVSPLRMKRVIMARVKIALYVITVSHGAMIQGLTSVYSISAFINDREPSHPHSHSLRTTTVQYCKITDPLIRNSM